MGLLDFLRPSPRRWRDAPVVREAPFDSASFVRSAQQREYLVRLPNFGHVHLEGLAGAARSLPAPSAVVLYGSSVRPRGVRPRDVDVLWLCSPDVHGGSLSDGGRFDGESVSDDGYGAFTYLRRGLFHVAVATTESFLALRGARDEWARTAVQHGVLLASEGRTRDAAGVRWLRSLRRVRDGSYFVFEVATLR